LVEDNIINQKVALSFLKKLGYQSDVASDGNEAVKAMTQYKYALVFMDCQMPKMDGYEATMCIRDAQYKALNPNTPIIAMTANAMKGDKEKCIDAGMNDYLSKPIDAKRLDAMLKKWMRKKVA
jgi:CheY-like chemotaxis protein